MSLYYVIHKTTPST